MDAVCTDQNVATDGVTMRTVAIEKVSGDAAVILLEIAQAASGMDPAFSEPRAHRLMDHALQAAAMNGELRHVITGVEAARLAPDLLAEPIGVDQFEGADRCRVEPLHQTKLRQFLDRVR